LSTGRPARAGKGRKTATRGTIFGDKAMARCPQTAHGATGRPPRRRLPCLGLALAALSFLCLPLCAGRAGPQEPQLADLMSAQLWAKYQSRPKYKDRIEIYHQAFDQLAGRLRTHLKKMEMDQVAESLHKISALARLAREEPARASAGPKDLASKQVRKLEIHIRRTVVTFNDYRLSVPFDFRADFESTTKDLEEWRNQLLMQLFGKAAAASREPQP
jgi:hypothetical protein